MESFNLNIIPGKDRPVCHASQYDIGRTIRVNLFEGFNVFTLDGTETISISVRKPDGNVVTESVTNTSDSYVEFVTTEQMTACHGSNLCELKLEKGADVIGTMNFILEVEQDPLEGGVQSASEIDNLQTQIAGMVATEVADQYDSANVIFDNDPTAGHGIGYAVTSEGVKNANDAAVSTVEDIIGDAYDENNSYTAGDYCIYSDVLYKCNGSTTGTFDPSKWDATTVADELQSAESAIAASSAAITSLKTYIADESFVHNGVRVRIVEYFNHYEVIAGGTATATDNDAVDILDISAKCDNQYNMQGIITPYSDPTVRGYLLFNVGKIKLKITQTGYCMGWLIIPKTVT